MKHNDILSLNELSHSSFSHNNHFNLITAISLAECDLKKEIA
jgi:hypothetical protein